MIITVLYRRSVPVCLLLKLTKVLTLHVKQNIQTCQSITTIYFIYIKIVYCQGDMFRPSLGHLQALKENRSKITSIFIVVKTHCGTPNLQKIYVILDLFSLRA
jgi:hypothetical protein